MSNHFHGESDLLSFLESYRKNFPDDPKTPELISELLSLARFRYEALGPLRDIVEQNGYVLEDHMATLSVPSRVLNRISGAAAITAMPKGLPETCYVIVPGNDPGNRVGIVVRGGIGYLKTSIDNPSYDPRTLSELVRSMNDEQGVTADQEEAMLVGSMIGWHVPGADPKTWEDRK